MATSVEVAVYCTDPELSRHLRWLGALPETDPGKHDCLAHLYMTMARAEWRASEHLRASEADHARRSAAAKRRRPRDA